MGIKHKQVPAKRRLVYCELCEKDTRVVGWFCSGMCDQPKVNALRSDRRKTKKRKKACK